MKSVGLLPGNKNPETVDQQLLQDLWTLVRGEENQGVSQDTMRVVLLNVIGTRVPDREYKKTADADETSVIEEGEVAPTNVSDIDLSKIGFFNDQGNFYLRRGDHSKIFTYFKNFYIHRMQFVGSQKKSQLAPSGEGRGSYQPKISEKTAKYAQQKRQKMMAEKGGNVTLVEILLHPASKGKEWQEQQQKIKESKQQEECTFKPQTINYQGGANKETSGDKCLDLYQSKPKGWTKDKTDQSSDDYQFAKEKDQYTFTPEINKPGKSTAAVQGGNISEVRGLGNVVDRMAKGRQQQLEKKMATERGMPAQLQAKEGQPEPIWGFGKNTDKFKSGFGAEGSSIVKKGTGKYADAQYSSKSQTVAQQRSPGKQVSVRQAAAKSYYDSGAGAKRGGKKGEEVTEYEEVVQEHKPKMFQMTKQATIFEKNIQPAEDYQQTTTTSKAYPVPYESGLGGDKISTGNDYELQQQQRNSQIAGGASSGGISGSASGSESFTKQQQQNPASQQ